MNDFLRDSLLPLDSETFHARFLVTDLGYWICQKRKVVRNMTYTLRRGGGKEEDSYKIWSESEIFQVSYTSCEVARSPANLAHMHTNLAEASKLMIGLSSNSAPFSPPSGDTVISRSRIMWYFHTHGNRDHPPRTLILDLVMPWPLWQIPTSRAKEAGAAEKQAGGLLEISLVVGASVCTTSVKFFVLWRTVIVVDHNSCHFRCRSHAAAEKVWSADALSWAL